MTVPARRWLLLAAPIAVWPCLASTVVAPTPAAATLLGKPVQPDDGESLRYEVLRALGQRYTRSRGIRATPAEIDAYLAVKKRTFERDRDRVQKERDVLAQRLAGLPRDDAGQAALTRELAEKTALTQALDELLRATDDPGDRAAQREVAAAFIVHWKFHRALYRQYGGRIVYQQGGPEPLDAVRRFLEQHQARGDFRIADPALAAAFWRHYRDDSIHSFYARGSPEEAQAFAAPPWQAR